MELVQSNSSELAMKFGKNLYPSGLNIKYQRASYKSDSDSFSVSVMSM